VKLLARDSFCHTKLNVCLYDAGKTQVTSNTDFIAVEYSLLVDECFNMVVKAPS
jgi:hypothetical protein